MAFTSLLLYPALHAWPDMHDYSSEPSVNLHQTSVDTSFLAPKLGKFGAVQQLRGHEGRAILCQVLLPFV